VFVLLIAVPALLVVVGYVLGHGLWTWLGGLADDAFGTSVEGGAEAVGWVTGLLALAGAVRLGVGLRRRRANGGGARRPRPWDGGPA
jgi:hypothetical protein